MNKEAYKILKNIAANSFSNVNYIGLRTMLQTDEHFEKYMERNYRIKAFSKEHDFYMTRNELDFHFIGFLDALLWLNRSNMLKPSNVQIADDEDYNDSADAGFDEEDSSINEEPDEEEKAVWKYIIYCETGESD